MAIYTDKDFIDVVDEAGTPQPHPIPKQWIGTDLAPGMKPAKGKKKSDDDSGEVEIPDGDPNDNWTVKQIDAYAKREGIDFDDEPNKAEKLDAIAKAKGKTVPVTGQ